MGWRVIFKHYFLLGIFISRFFIMIINVITKITLTNNDKTMYWRALQALNAHCLWKIHTWWVHNLGDLNTAGFINPYTPILSFKTYSSAQIYINIYSKLCPQYWILQKIFQICFLKSPHSIKNNFQFI